MSNTTIGSAFSLLKDPRKKNIKHPLINIITMTLCAVISGCNDFESIAEYAKTKKDFFKSFLDLESGVPSADTFLDVMNRLNPTQFEKAFTDWVLSLRSFNEDIIAIDGKTLRGTADKINGAFPIHLVNAWSVANNMCFGQLRVSEKSNEITAIPKLLELLDIKGATITMDAMGCQTKIANQIVESEADYIMALKGNQGTLHEDVNLYLSTEIKRAFKDKQHGYFEDVVGDHGRIEQRKVWVTDDVKWLVDRHPDWKTIQSIIAVQSIRDIKGKGKTEELRFYISSKAGVDAQKMANAIRSHWEVENKLHWQLDVSFDEDACRLRSGHAPQNLSLFNKVALNLLKNETTVKKGIKTKRMKAGWDDAYLLKVLSIGKLTV